MKTLPKVRDYMDHEVYTVSADTPMQKVVNLLISRHVTGAPVVDADGHVLGIITEKDCLRLLAEGLNNLPPTNATAADLMTKDVVTVPSNADVYYAAGVFLKNNFRRLLVLEDNKLAGALTRFDLLRAIEANLVWP